MTSLIMGYSGFGQNLKNKIRNSSFLKKCEKYKSYKIWKKCEIRDLSIPGIYGTSDNLHKPSDADE